MKGHHIGIGNRKGTGVPPDVRQALKLLDLEAVETLRRVLKGKGSPAAQVAAAIHILDRNHGRVAQKIEGDVQSVLRVQIMPIAPRLIGEGGGDGEDAGADPLGGDGSGDA